jgi:hypothetical protein
MDKGQRMGRGTFVLALVCAAMAVAVIGPALAAPAPAPPGPAPAPPSPGHGRESAEVVFLGIHATKESSPHVDPALQPLADLLPLSKYNSFRVVVSDTRSLQAGSETVIALVEGYGLTLRIEKMTVDSAQIVLSWTRVEKDSQGRPQTRPPQRVQMTLRRGKYFLTGGWQLQNGALFALVAVK